jgi:hypothetical protein
MHENACYVELEKLGQAEPAKCNVFVTAVP